MREITVKSLSTIEWDVDGGDVDFHVRLEADEFAIDAFKSQVQDPNMAYLDSTVVDTLDDALDLCRRFNGRDFISSLPLQPLQ